MRQAMMEEMKFWVREVDIDGYRCDYVDGVPREFWTEVIRELNNIKPVFMLGENDGGYGLNDPFDSHYSFSLMDIINGIARGTRTPKEIVSLFNNYKKSYQSGIFPMVYTTNHDMNSWTGSINTLLHDATKMMNVMTFTLPGMPLIYSGQEVNDPQQLLFFEKDEINWGDWETNSYHTFYQQLTNLKHTNKALASDDLNNLTITHESNQVLKYSRITEDSTVLVFLNMTSNQQEASFTFEAGTYTDYFSQKKVTYEGNDSITIPVWGYYVYIK
jgi:glycosidase